MKAIPIKEVIQRLNDVGLKHIADQITDIHRLAGEIKLVRPRIKMTTAYKLAEKLHKEIGIEKKRREMLRKG